MPHCSQPVLAGHTPTFECQVRVSVEPDGSVAAVDALADTLVADPAEYQGVIAETDDGDDINEDACADLRYALHAALSQPTFPEAKGRSVITVPLSFG